MPNPAPVAADRRRCWSHPNILPSAPWIERAGFVLRAGLAARWFPPLPLERTDCGTTWPLSRTLQLRLSSKSVRRQTKSARWQGSDTGPKPQRAPWGDAPRCSVPDQCPCRVRGSEDRYAGPPETRSKLAPDRSFHATEHAPGWRGAPESVDPTSEPDPTPRVPDR